MGVKALPPQQAVSALGYLLGASCIQTTVADVDWTLFKDLYQARGQRSLLEHIATQLQETIKRHSDQKSKILERLEAAKQSDKEGILITYIQGEVAQVLGCDPSQLDPQQGFFDMGMDSLMAFELKKRLESSFSSSLPSTLTFESPTIKKLSRYLAQEVLGWKLPKTPDADQLQSKNEKVKALSAVEELTDDEVEASIISQKLAKLEFLVKGN
ncbi:acyl carrier protein [Scytonema sp. PRP1]|uniref:acyl carrier protein n=1 Tax=Scytonema sp. PRP1 TaxID=3120513 RepID=UPI002FD1FAC8